MDSDERTTGDRVERDPPDPPDSPVAQVVATVRAGRRHQGIADTTLHRLARTALTAADGDVTEAVKRTKRGLHEVYGAYLPTNPPRYRAMLRDLRAAAAAGPQELRAALTRAMAGHASTRERLPQLAQFQQRLTDELGLSDWPGVRVQDLACGFQPLAVPWLDLPPDAVYLASDVDAGLVGFVAEALTLLGADHQARVLDLAEGPPVEPADVTLLLKTVPCLERQRAGAGWQLLDQVAWPAVVTFPTRSLGHRAKGMYQTYSAAFDRWAQSREVDVTEYEIGTELVYVVWRSG